MQAQSRLSANGAAGSAGLEPAAAADERDAVVRELTLGHELTARLQEEALRALRGQGQAEATAAFILREVSRAFTVCLSIMGGAASHPAAAPPSTDDSAVPEGARRAKDDGVPRKRIETPSPDSDGHEWRKYGQKRIMNTSFPRCYYKCRYRRERGCPAMKQVQKRNEGDQPMYIVMYAHEHTCDTPAPAPEPVDPATDEPLGFSRLSRQQQQQQGARAAGALLHGVDQLAGGSSTEERELQAFVSSLAHVLQQGRQAPAFSAGGAAATAPDEPGLRQGRAGGDDVGASTWGHVGDDDAPSELPTVDVDEGFGGLDVMDYVDVTDTMCFDTSDGLPF